MIPVAAEFAGIGFTKLQKFAEILRLNFINKTNYYEHRGDFIFPEVHSAWKKINVYKLMKFKSLGDHYIWKVMDSVTCLDIMLPIIQ